MRYWLSGTSSATGYLTEEGITAYVEIYSPYTPPEDTPYPSLKQIDYGNQTPVSVVVGVVLDSEIEALPEFTLKLIVQGTAERWNLDGSNATTADFHVNPGRSENSTALGEYYIADGSAVELFEYAQLTGNDGEVWYITFKPDAFKLMTPESTRVDSVTIPIYSNGSKELTEAEQAEDAEPKYLAIRPVPLEDIGNALPIYWDNDATQLLLFMASVGADKAPYLFKVLFAGGKLQGFGVENEVDLELDGYEPVGITNMGSGYNAIARNNTDTFSYGLISSEGISIVSPTYENFFRYNAASPIDLNLYQTIDPRYLYAIDTGHTPFTKGYFFRYATGNLNAGSGIVQIYCDKNAYPNYKTDINGTITELRQYPYYPAAAWKLLIGNKEIGTGQSSYVNFSSTGLLNRWSVTNIGEFQLEYEGGYKNKVFYVDKDNETLTESLLVRLTGEINAFNTVNHDSINDEDVYTFYTFERFSDAVEAIYPPFSLHAQYGYSLVSRLSEIIDYMSINSPYETRVSQRINENLIHSSSLPYLLIQSNTTVMYGVDAVGISSQYILNNTATFDSSRTSFPLTLSGNGLLTRLAGTNDYGTRETIITTPYHSRYIIKTANATFDCSDFAGNVLDFGSRFFCIATTGIDQAVTLNQSYSLTATLTNHLYVGVNNIYKYYYLNSYSAVSTEYSVAGDGTNPTISHTPTSYEFNFPVIEGHSVFVCDMTGDENKFYLAEISGLTYTDSYKDYSSLSLGGGLEIGIEGNTRRVFTGFNLINKVEQEDIGFYMWENIYNDKMIIVPADDHAVSLIRYLRHTNGKTANIYTITDAQGNETAELAIASKNIKINDNFIDAIELTGQNVSVRGNNTTATAEEGEPPAEGTLNSLWYKWTAPSSQKVFIHCRPTGETGAFLSTIYTEGLSEAVPRAEDESITPVSGTTYYIQCDGGDNWVGEFILAISTVSVFDQPEPILEADRVGYADIYWFDTAALAWKRKGAVSSPVSRLDGAAEYISYHPGVVEEGG